MRTACLLSVCTSGLRTPETGRGGRLRRAPLAGRRPALIGAGVPNVLAWSNLAYMDDCARITPIWHEQYLKGEDPRIATQKARRAIFTAKEYSFGWLAHFTG
ncbi:MAG: hypothetical protein IPN01_19300 [Deltaproteobacteria bacterium]|nr:hypothetical protein [Deltaproteobacteria bacterium]